MVVVGSNSHLVEVQVPNFTISVFSVSMEFFQCSLSMSHATLNVFEISLSQCQLFPQAV